MKKCLIIFVKEPIRGNVKTRLGSHLSQLECVRLYKNFLKYAIDLARGIKCSDKIIAYDSCGKRPDYLRKIAPDFKFYMQKGRDLGERMSNAFIDFTSDNTKTVLIGSDSPGLPKNYINKAFSELASNDLVLGPTYDGGYYLIGMKDNCEEIFRGIKWSSSAVFEETLKKAKKMKKKTAVLNTWYDIDTTEDLKYLEKYGAKK
jgi:rSAM/selenodomain-associated transferase 1